MLLYISRRANEVWVSHGRVFVPEYLQNGSACLGVNVVRLENSLAIADGETAYGLAEATGEQQTWR